MTSGHPASARTTTGAPSLPAARAINREDTVAHLRTSAAEMRSVGNFQYAADLYRQAALLADDPATALNSQMRRAYCLLAIELTDKAVIIAERVAQHARSEAVYGELVDALSLLVDFHFARGRIALANEMLGEALYVLSQMPSEDVEHLLLHNLAVTLARTGFLGEAIELYDRSLRAAATDEDRCFAYANLAATYNLAAISELDPDRRLGLLHDGLRSADAATDPAGSADVMGQALARSHRALALTQIERYDEALAEAGVAHGLAMVYGMREEQVVAEVARSIARWNVSKDVDVLRQIASTMALAEAIDYVDIAAPLRQLEVDILWSLGRHEDARRVMTGIEAGLRARLDSERDARWATVRLGIDGRHTDLLRDSDPLTGLGNRRFLAATLCEVDATSSPAMVGLIDIDAFGAFNERHGYAVGDHLLQELARLLERVCRRGDEVARLGGDDFALVLRGTSPNDARTVFERTRQLIAVHRWDGLKDETVTVSIGIAPVTGESADDMLATAREAMLGVKRGGGNGVSIAHR
jgi:diguanylate cyclase (GGDEF)-like protein